MTRTVMMKLERETKGALRYQETDGTGQVVELQDSLIGTLYVRKSALGDMKPQKISVTVEVAK